MKKTILYISAVAMVAAVSCNKAELNNSTESQSSSESLVFTAYADEETKTTLNDDKTVSWSAEDEISISGVQYITDEGGKIASFRKADNDVADPEGPYYAVYPWHASLNEQFDVNLASHVTKDRAASIINAISVAYSETTTLKFKNVCSIIKFQVPEFAEDITEITVSSDNALIGTAKVSYNGGEPTWGESEVGELEYSITLTPPTGDKFEKDTDYYVAIYPGTKTNLVFRINGYLAATVSSVDFERSEIRGIGTIPAPVIRLYIQSEYTHFDMNIYAWGIDGVSLPNEWPGKPLKWDAEEGKYYYDFPYEIKGKKLNYIINNGTYQTADLDDTISSSEYTNDTDVNWHWLYFKPSNNWKSDNPWYAACFTGGDGEYWMRSIGPDENGVYGFVQPPTRTKVEFTRMNPATNDMNWSNKWNSTAQLTIPTDGKNYFQCTEGWWNSHNGPWTTYTLPTE